MDLRLPHPAIVEKALWAAPIVLVLALGYTHRWTSDDGFVYFRIVDQIRAGNGPVFNAGQRVEAFSSPLWLGVLAVADLVSPFRLEYTSIGLSLGCVAAGMVLATLGAAALMRSDDDTRIRIPFGILVIAVLWPVWVWSTGGTEIALTFAWTGACCFLLARWAVKPRSAQGLQEVPASTLVLLGLGWLVRPELAMSSALFVVTVAFMSASSLRRRWRIVLISAAGPVLYELFRMAYFGLLIPTRVIASESTMARPGLGWEYFNNTFTPYLLAVPLLAVVFVVYGPLLREFAGHETRRGAVLAVVAGSGVCQIVVVVLAGGTSNHARLFLPGLFAVVAPVFVLPVRRHSIDAVVATTAWAIVALILMRPPESASMAPIVRGYVPGRVTYQSAGFDHRGADQPWIEGPGLYVADAFRTGGRRISISLAEADRTLVATGSIGPAGYALGPDVDVVDLYGSADPQIAHQSLYYQLLPGLEKAGYAPWLVARLSADPRSVLPGQFTLERPLTDNTESLEYVEQVRWAMAALDCDAFQRLDDSADRPLSIGRIASNLWDSIENTTLRYDSSPQTAYLATCGTDRPAIVQAYYDDAAVGDQLPPPPRTAGDVAVIGSCASAFISTGDESNPWLIAAARSVVATAALDPDDPVARRWPVADFASALGPAATITLETNGNGDFRVRQDTERFVPAVQSWTAIPISDEVDLAIEPNLAAGRWTTTVNGVPLGEVPIIERGPQSEPAALVIHTVAATGPLAVQTLGGEGVASCEHILDHRRPPN